MAKGNITELQELVKERRRLRELIVSKGKQAEHDVRVKEMKKLFGDLHQAYEKTKQIEQEYVELFDKAFNRLSNQTKFTTIKLGREEYSSERPISLTKTGFATYETYSYSDRKRSEPIDHEQKRRIVLLYQLTDYIANTEKREIFEAFHNEMSNWIDRSARTIFSVCGEITRIRFTKDYDAKIEDIQEEFYRKLALKLYNTGAPSVDYYDRANTPLTDENENINIDDLSIGDFMILCQYLTDEHKELIQCATKSLNSIAENNELVLNKIRRKIAHYIVAEAL